MKRRPTIDYVGSILVLLVVVLVPTFLGALSSGSLPVTDAALTTADASATALHALGRDIMDGELPPAQALADAPHWWNAARDTTTAHEGTLEAPRCATPATDIAIESARLL